MNNANLPAIHPGEILLELYMKPLGLSAGGLATRLNVPRTRIERLVAGKTALTSDTALRLARFFGTTPQFWMNMQTAFELKTQAAELAPELEKIAALAAA